MYACMYTVCSGACTCMPQVGSRQASKINLFGLHFCVICCEFHGIIQYEGNM